MQNNRKYNLKHLCTDPNWISTQYFLLFILFGFQQLHAQAQQLLGQHDGPYFFYEAGNTKSVRVVDGKIQVDNSLKEPFSVSTEDGQYHFEVSRHPITVPKEVYRPSDKIIVLSDPHGDFASFYAILKAQKVVNANYEWTFGNNQLVVIGDVFDRGKDVLPIFWLIYKLEHEAVKAGGQVHFLLGNHEEMLMRGNYKYTQDKYKVLADSIGRSYRDFWSSETELGRWLQSKNTMEKIGDYLFVHAGLSTAMLDPKWTIPAVNDSVRRYLFHTKEERQQSDAASFLFGSEGPLWYRGMVVKEEKYHPLGEEDLNNMMKIYGAKQIFVGHTIFPEVSSFYEGKVYGVNVNNESNRLKGRSRGLLIEGGKIKVIYDDITKNKVIN